MGTTRRQTIADRIYAEREEHDRAYADYRKTGNTKRINASDRRMARLQQELTNAGDNLYIAPGK
ncbi:MULTISPECIES: hypothetical protein [unclassified Bradyrhizobium]|uniref:hypothetical protein n=1 Tax=unclassified Bradyrhizobium TaxID=2631580 RepID=UPI0028E7278E|nr:MULTISPECIES: hypothetical protein [unclassified Bradyrhizobium]